MTAEPKTPEQWQDAVDSAHVLLCIDSARQYGLVEWNAEIDIERCEEILKRGHGHGYTPSHDAVQRFLAEWEFRDQV